MKGHIRRLISQFVSSLSESIALAPSLRKLRSGALLCVLALVSIVAVFTQAKESVFFFGGVLVAEAKICPVRNLKLVKVVNATNEIETNRLLFSRVVRSYSHGPGELLPLFWRNNGFVRFSIPIFVAGPCPGRTVMFSSSGHSFSRMPRSKS